MIRMIKLGVQECIFELRSCLNSQGLVEQWFFHSNYREKLIYLCKIKLALLFLQNFLRDLLHEAKKSQEVSEDQLIQYTDTMVSLGSFSSIFQNWIRILK